MRSRKKSPGPGRPRKNPDEVKSRTIQLRVTEEEHQALRDAAEGAQETLSGWMLTVTLRAAQRARKGR